MKGLGYLIYCNLSVSTQTGNFEEKKTYMTYKVGREGKRQCTGICICICICRVLH